VVLEGKGQKFPEDRSESAIFSVGTSHRSSQAFFDLLAEHRIRRLVDVRRFPTSSRFPHFTQGCLKALAGEEGLEYFYLGDLLGGYRRGGYDQHVLTRKFQTGLHRLEGLASQAPTAVLCAERFPWRCHRRYIAAALEERGWQVVHIIDPGRTWSPEKKENGHEKNARGQIELDLPG
jgi:uncharacterized protein (DUF488 family)